MLPEISFDFLYLIVFIVSVIIAYFIFKNNKIFHKQKMLNDLVSKERDLRMSLNEYQEKIDVTKNKYLLDKLWNDHDNLLFNFYEYLAIIIFGDYLIERGSRIYFRRLLVDVYRAFIDDKGFFKSANVSRNDYFNLMNLFKRWRIDKLYVEVVEKN